MDEMDSKQANVGNFNSMNDINQINMEINNTLNNIRIKNKNRYARTEGSQSASEVRMTCGRASI